MTKPSTGGHIDKLVIIEGVNGNMPCMADSKYSHFLPPLRSTFGDCLRNSRDSQQPDGSAHNFPVAMILHTCSALLVVVLRSHSSPGAFEKIQGEILANAVVQLPTTEQQAGVSINTQLISR